MVSQRIEKKRKNSFDLCNSVILQNYVDFFRIRPTVYWSQKGRQLSNTTILCHLPSNHWIFPSYILSSYTIHSEFKLRKTRRRARATTALKSSLKHIIGCECDPIAIIFHFKKLFMLWYLAPNQSFINVRFASKAILTTDVKTVYKARLLLNSF